MTDQPQTPEPDSATPVQPTVVSPVQPTVVSPAQRAPATPVPPAPSGSYAKPSAPAPVDWPPAPQLADEASDGTGTSPAADRPELAIGGAFAGGFLLAMILKRLAR